MVVLASLWYEGSPYLVASSMIITMSMSNWMRISIFILIFVPS